MEIAVTKPGIVNSLAAISTGMPRLAQSCGGHRADRGHLNSFQVCALSNQSNKVLDGGGTGEGDHVRALAFIL